MKILEKIKLVNSFFDLFNIKIGKIIKKGNNCYQVNNWFSVFFKFYYAGPVFFIILFIFLLFPHIWMNIYIQMIESLTIFLIVEIVILLFLPIRKVDCWKKSLQEKN